MKQIKLLTSALAATILALPLLAADQPNTLSEKEQAAGWQLLFNGKDLTGWRAYKTPEGPGQIGAGWTVEAGLLKKRAGVKGGDIITEQQFDDFELTWEWRIEPGANNGVGNVSDLHNLIIC